LYGGYYDFTTVTSTLSNRLAQTIDRARLIEILTVELPQQMQISRSAILLVRKDDCLELQQPGDYPFLVSIENDGVCILLAERRKPIRSQELWMVHEPQKAQLWSPFHWGQVFAPIYHDRLLGVLVLGDRSGGDIYSNQDLEIIHTVSQQAALSYANIRLVEAFRGLSRQLVRTDEEQRRKIAQDLHDEVLQKMFFFKGRLANYDPELRDYLDHMITQLRQTIRSQRPSWLNGGLVLALKGLVEEMNQTAGGKTIIKLHNTLSDSPDLGEEQALSIYRIVQEALTNVLKHADADEAVVTMRRVQDILEVLVADNGVGFANSHQTRSDHYGLLGMQERAAMIGAILMITSEPENGTSVSLRLPV
jgi:signal transduction histidine kinase